MRKISSLKYFIVMSLSFTSFNLYLSNLILNKIQQGWHFSTSLLRIVYVENTGAAFSIMQNSTKLLIVLSLIALCSIVYYIINHSRILEKKELFFLAFLSAGILGNFGERLLLGHVRDFFDLAFINFPIFNISDVFISIGVFGTIILLFLTKKSIELL